MIKSSDNQFRNTYRILRVLANHDYLATDPQEQKYIFCESKVSLHLPNPNPNKDPVQHKQLGYTLRHREIIEIDHIEYAVFPIGNNEPVWAAHLQKKHIQNQPFLYKIIKHSLQNILKELIWMGAPEAKKYLDLRNFWMINDSIYFLLLPRMKKAHYSIKKSQKQMISKQKMDMIIEGEKIIMRQFGLILWQICFQTSYEGIKDSNEVQNLLKLMINKECSFQDIMKIVSNKHQQKLRQSRKVRYRTISHYDIFQRKNTQSSSLGKSSQSKKSSQANLSASRMSIQQSKTLQFTKRNYIVLKNRIIVQDRSYSKPKQYRRKVQQSTISNLAKQKPSRQSSLVGRRLQTYSSNKDAKYDSWLNNKKYSQQIRQKLIRNGQIARRKFKQTIQDSRQQKQVQKFEDANFKEKILSRVIRFKNAFKQKNSSISQNENEKSQYKKGNYQASHPQISVQIAKQEKTINEQASNQMNLIKMHQQRPNMQREQNKNKQQIGLQDDPIYEINMKQVMRIQFNENEEKINNQYIQEEKKDFNSLKTEKRKLKRTDMFVSSCEDDIEVVKLQTKPKIQRNDQEENVPLLPTIAFKNNLNSIIVPSKMQKEKHQNKSKQVYKIQPFEAVNEYIVLINTLADTTVRAVKNKEKLKDFNWRIVTYFLYERFQMQRRKLVQALLSNKIISRKNRKVDNNQWKLYLKSQQRKDLALKINKENQQITATLNRLGQKLIQEESLQSKSEYFIRNRQRLLKNQKLRPQLSRLLMSNILDQFQYFFEQNIQNEQAFIFLTDCLFSSYVVAQLDEILPEGKYMLLDDYKEYKKSIGTIKQMFAYIEGLYFNNNRERRQKL